MGVRKILIISLNLFLLGIFSIILIKQNSIQRKILNASKKPKLIEKVSVLISQTVTPEQEPTVKNSPSPTTSLQSFSYYVSPGGNNQNNGSINSPFKTIQKAIDAAQPGNIINLGDGEYFENLVTKRDGKKDLPITITGSGNAVLKGRDGARLFEINHDYIELKGFTIDGHHGASNTKSSYTDKLIYALGKEPKSGVEGLKILNMVIKNAGGECIRLRYFAKNNEIGNNTIQNCGLIDYRFNGEGKNGEGVYIGTAPEQTKDGKNPTSDTDQSSNNWIHHNNFDTQGNECVDIKEGANNNIIEFNKCTGQKDSNSGGMDSRGEANTFRFNEIFGNSGAGIRLGGDENNDGINNNVYKNIIKDNQSGGIKFQRKPQAVICGNTMSGNNGGDSVGSFGSDYNPTETCISTLNP